VKFNNVAVWICELPIIFRNILHQTQAAWAAMGCNLLNPIVVRLGLWRGTRIGGFEHKQTAVFAGEFRSSLAPHLGHVPIIVKIQSPFYTTSLVP